MRYIFASRRIDLLLIVGSAYFYQLLPSLKAEYPRLPVADLLFNVIGHTGSNRRYAELIDLNLVENQEVSRYLTEAGESPDRIKVIHSGVDLERYRPSGKSHEVLERTRLDRR